MNPRGTLGDRGGLRVDGVDPKTLSPGRSPTLYGPFLLRNARSPLEKEAYHGFAQRFKEILSSPASAAREKGWALGDRFPDQAPTFIRHIRQRVDIDRAFTPYPDILWWHLRPPMPSKDSII
jgi:hypothetical protein